MENVSMRRISLSLIVFVAALSVGSALAQTAPQHLADTYKVDYFDNANTSGAPDAKLRLSNPGTAGGDVCADIYVFDTQQELSECCSCLLSPNGLRILSVNNDLNGNPLTGKALIAGSIEIVSNVLTGSGCPEFPTTITPASGGVRAWATHIQDNGNGGWSITESSSQDATMTKAEENRLVSQCNAIKLNSDGGECSCGTGDSASLRNRQKSADPVVTR
jgi:hypothetical protein